MENEVTNNEPVSEEALEAEVNAAAVTEQTGKTGDSSIAAGTGSTEQKTTPNTVGKVEPEFDVRKSYEELRRDYTRKTQALSTYEKQQADMASKLQEMQSRLEEATKKPVDLEKFFQDLKAQGPNAILPYIKPELDKATKSFEDKYGQLGNENSALRLEVSLLNRRMDSKNYPNFTDLEPKMRELVESGKAPVDFNRPTDEVIDALYNLVRSQNSVEAIKVAEKAAYSKAQAELAKESKTAVAGGGKGTSTTPADLWKMPIDKLEALVEKMHGTADRD
jgi:chromosome segregation ATPase